MEAIRFRILAGKDNVLYKVLRVDQECFGACSKDEIMFAWTSKF
jgi:hypothetical protein